MFGSVKSEKSDSQSVKNLSKNGDKGNDSFNFDQFENKININVQKDLKPSSQPKEKAGELNFSMFGSV